MHICYLTLSLQAVYFIQTGTVVLTVYCVVHSRYLHKVYLQRQLQLQLPNDVMYLASDYPCHKTCTARTPAQLFDAHIQLEDYCQRAMR